MKKDEQHYTKVVESLGTTNNTEGMWRARCSCGWFSQWQETESDAENEATDHVVAVA